MKNKSVLLWGFVFLFVSCNRNKYISQAIEERVYMPIPIAEEKSYFEIDFDKLTGINYDDKLSSLDLTCNINSACIKTGTIVEEDDISLVVAKEKDRTIFEKTRDVDFKTKSGLSIESPVSKYFEVCGAELFVEPGTCVYIQLEDDWRACISMANMVIKLDEPILYFYKVDPKYSNAMSLKEWNCVQ